MFDLLNFKFAHLQRNKQSIFYDTFILLDRNRISTKTLKKKPHITKELSKDVRDKIIDKHKAGILEFGYKTIRKKSVMKRTQLLVQLFENGNGIKIAII